MEEEAVFTLTDTEYHFNRWIKRLEYITTYLEYEDELEQLLDALKRSMEHPQSLEGTE